MTFHSQIDGQVKHTTQTLEDILRSCKNNFKGNWYDHLPLIEFAYHNNYHSSVGKTPFLVLYGKRCRSHIGLLEVGNVSSELDVSKKRLQNRFQENVGATHGLHSRIVG